MKHQHAWTNRACIRCMPSGQKGGLLAGQMSVHPATNLLVGPSDRAHLITLHSMTHNG